MSDSDLIHQLNRIIDHERERAVNAKLDQLEAVRKYETLLKQTELVSNAFMELLAILEHYQIEVTAEILSPLTYSLIMNLRLRLND